MKYLLIVLLCMFSCQAPTESEEDEVVTPKIQTMVIHNKLYSVHTQVFYDINVYIDNSFAGKIYYDNKRGFKFPDTENHKVEIISIPYVAEYSSSWMVNVNSGRTYNLIYDTNGLHE